MADAGNPEIAQAYEAVRKQNAENDWLLIGYPEDPKDYKLVLVGTGAGGVEAMKENLADDKMYYGYLKVIAGDNESKRTKFVFISYCGENVSAIRRAKMSVHKADVKKVIKDFGVEMHATSKNDLDGAEIQKAVKKSMGADYSANT